MAITDELRHNIEGAEQLYGRECPRLRAIADRIDEAHEEAMSRAAQLLADAEKDRDLNYANWQDCKQKVLQHSITIDELSAEIERLKDELAHRIEPPEDADDEYVHIGDVMGDRGFPDAKYTVVGIGKDEFFTRDAYGELREHTASLYIHYKQPTVEDVLREFALAVCKDEALTIRRGVVEEYAAKLQLREEA